jgi:hypothetical protein
MLLRASAVLSRAQLKALAAISNGAFGKLSGKVHWVQWVRGYILVLGKADMIIALRNVRL